MTESISEFPLSDRVALNFFESFRLNFDSATEKRKIINKLQGNLNLSQGGCELTF